MSVVAKPRYEVLHRRLMMTCRSVRPILDAVGETVRHFANQRGMKFRGRKFGLEAYLNAAAWHLAELPRDEQERILRCYLDRLEGHLILPDDGSRDTTACSN